MKSFLKEFKAFAMRGNVIDLAVGVIIGGAFQKIVSSLVNDVIMPLISLLTKETDFSGRFSARYLGTVGQSGSAALKRVASLSAISAAA